MSSRFVFVLWALLFATALPAQVTAVDSVGMTVSDMDRATDFYSRVLTFEKEADRVVGGTQRARIVRMRLGEEHIELMQFLASGARPFPADSRGNDRWFQHVAIIVSNMPKAYSRLRQHGVEHASPWPQRLPDWNPNAGGIEAFYFRDPDGHYLEVLAFPPGKGAAKWQARDGRLFLGIDHTAIVVADTEASLAFYRDRLGLAVAGASENYGIEQERLNDVPGARLRITAMRAPKGPGIEFLEYLSPRDGRPMPADTRPTDLWFWQINLRSPEEPTGSLVRDPDGHASLIANGR